MPVRSHRSRAFALSFVAGLATSGAARADDEPAATAAPAASADAPSDDSAVKLTPVGYVEAYYQYNLQRPSNGVTAYRGFDNRHDTFTLANAAVGGSMEAGPVSARLVLQIGSTPTSYYAAEPAFPGAAGAGPSGPDVWKYLQEANFGWNAPVGRGLLVQMGLFLSPIGPETIAVKDNFNWSRSNLFFGLPFYHTGIRATYPVTDELSVTAHVYNGWNSVVDNNEEKSVALSAAYKLTDELNAQLMYFGGVERATGAPEGPYWRHDVDAYAQFEATRAISLLAHVNGGWEPTRFGAASWYGGALYARARLAPWLYVAARVDRFSEDLARNATGASTPIFFGGARWVSEGTLTVDARPHDHVSVRLEFRHDQAARDLYFKSTVTGDGSPARPFVANTHGQDTLTLGATAWF